MTSSDTVIGTRGKNPYRPEIDGLRALAVLAVIFNHMNKEFIPTGYLGVDIFFVISGYVITASLLAKPSVNFRSFLLEFYARRIRRLLPALAVFVLVTALLTCLFNPLPSV
jgi:peptidoglycan/LPS O-acetylase OafA/YrhL